MNGNGEEEEQEAKRLGLESGGRSKMKRNQVQGEQNGVEILFPS